MTEFVEEGLEGLLPVFETLKGIQLLSPSEVNAFIKRCKSFEYRLQKTRKDVQSFKVYIDYLESVIKLIRMRRKRMKYRSKEEEIEGDIKIKIANLYWQCCERFQGRKENWLEMIEFLKREKMHRRCRKMFIRALQIFPRDYSLRIQAAQFEYSIEHRMECARVLMQEGLRLDVNQCNLWTSFVQLELDYVKWLITRRSILTGKGYPVPCTEGKELLVAKEALKNPEMRIAIEGKTGQDAVLGLRVVDAIIMQALANCNTNKSELLLSFWRTAKRYGLVANRLTEKLYDMLWSPKYKSEESWIAESELMEYDQESLYALFDRACIDQPTEKMHRHYLMICQRHYSLDRDPDAKAKCLEILFWLITYGHAIHTDMRKFDRLVDNDKEKEEILTEALKKSPESAFLWMMLLRAKILENPKDAETIRKLFDKATREAFVESYGISDMYKTAIDWAIEHSPKDVDDFFRRATFRTVPKIACEMRCLRLNYLISAYPERPGLYREEYLLFAKHPPNSMEVHRTFIRNEINSEYTSLCFVSHALDAMVREFGNQTHECWMDYAEVMLHYNPTILLTIHRRATTNLPPLELEMFMVKFENLMQSAALDYQGNNEDDDDNDDDDDVKNDDGNDDGDGKSDDDDVKSDDDNDDGDDMNDDDDDDDEIIELTDEDNDDDDDL